MARRNVHAMRTILTGASSGVGWHLAVQLVQKGARVIAVARRNDRLELLKKTIEESGGEIEIVSGDISQTDVRQQICDHAQEQFGGLDLLINNAGITGLGRFDEANEARLREIMEVNFFAPAELTRLALPMLKLGKQAAVANVGSVLGHRAVPLKSEYCASKFALHGLTDALRAELQKDQIDFVLVSPSSIASDLFETAIEDTSKRNWKTENGMKPEVVAKKILRGIEKGRHEIIISAGGRILVWLDRLSPPIMNRIVAKFGQ